MTVLYLGERQDILAQGSWDTVLDKPKPEPFRCTWGRFTFGRPYRRLYFDPDEADLFPMLVPHPEQDLGFTGDSVPRKWTAWAKKFGVEIKKLSRVTAGAIRQVLAKGLKHLTFTPDAIEWFVLNLDGDEVPKARMNTLCVQLLLTYPEPKLLTARDVANALGGAEQKLAARILESLGTPKAVELATRIPDSSSAYTLFVYLLKALSNQGSPWVASLLACKKGADDVRYDYKTGALLFSLCCLPTSGSTATSSTSRAAIDRQLDLYRITGIACSIAGTTMAS